MLFRVTTRFPRIVLKGYPTNIKSIRLYTKRLQLKLNCVDKSFTVPVISKSNLAVYVYFKIYSFKYGSLYVVEMVPLRGYNNLRNGCVLVADLLYLYYNHYYVRKPEIWSQDMIISNRYFHRTTVLFTISFTIWKPNIVYSFSCQGRQLILKSTIKCLILT